MWGQRWPSGRGNKHVSHKARLHSSHSPCSYFLSVLERRASAARDSPDADALVDSAEGLKDEEAGVLDEVLQASDQEEVVDQNLGDKSALGEGSGNTMQRLQVRLKAALTAV